MWNFCNLLPQFPMLWHYKSRLTYLLKKYTVSRKPSNAVECGCLDGVWFQGASAHCVSIQTALTWCEWETCIDILCFISSLAGLHSHLRSESKSGIPQGFLYTTDTVRLIQGRSLSCHSWSLPQTAREDTAASFRWESDLNGIISSWSFLDSNDGETTSRPPRMKCKKPLIVTNPFKDTSNYTLANKLLPNISAYMTFWSGDVKICCTASMGGLQNALSFTDNIHHLNLHKGLATWQQKTFQSQHKTPVPSMMALRTHTFTGLEWKIKARRWRLMVLPSYSRVTGHWRSTLHAMM